MNRPALTGPLASTFVLALACMPPRANENHCANQDGNAWCARTHPEDGKHYCGIANKEKSCGLELVEDGCYAEQPPDECYAPCGCGEGNDTVKGECDSYLDGNTECLDVAGSSSSGEPSTGDGSTTDDSETTGGSDDTTTGVPSCSDHPDCTDPAAPLCEPASQSCIPCEEFGNEADAACASKSDVAPVCAAAECVACTDENIGACAGTTPICDAGTNECGPCVAHAQCEASGACHIAEGSCFPETTVHVGPGEDYGTLTQALNGVEEDAFVIILHENSGGDPYVGNTTIDDGRTIAVFAADGDSPVLQGSASAALTISSASTVYLRGISINLTANGNDGLVASGQSVVYLEEVTVNGNTGLGIEASNATLVVDRSRITGNQQGGISLSNNSSLSLVNSFVGGDVSDVSAIQAVGSTFTILYSTILAGFGEATAIACNAGAGSSVRNSIVAARTDGTALECSGVEATTNALEDALPGNTMIDPLQTSWFSVFAAGDFTLSPQGAPVFEDVARWRTGDPASDIDGSEERPTEDDTPDYAGADLPN